MSNVRLRLPPKLIESARAAQYSNRERQGVKETNKKVAYRAKIEAKKQKKEQQQDEQRGGQLEHVKAKSYKVWTHPYCVCGGFLLIPSAIPDGTRFGTPPTYSFVSQEWVRKNPDDPDDRTLILRTVITPNPNGSLIRMSLAEGDFDACEYAVLGDIRTPEDEYQYPGYWPNKNQPYDELGNKAPGFVFDAASEMMVNSAIYESDRILMNWLDGQGDKWPEYIESGILAERNYGFFHHLATKTGPPAKPDQKMYDKHGVLLPMRFKRDASTQDNKDTPKDESIEAFGGDVYSTCTFEVIVSLGTAPLPSGTIQDVDRYLGPPNPDGSPKVLSHEFNRNGAVSMNRYYAVDNTCIVNPEDANLAAANTPACWTDPYLVVNQGTVVTPANSQSNAGLLINQPWERYWRGNLVVVIGDITFSIETLNQPDTNGGPRSKWVIYFWNSDLKIDDFIEVEPSSEYHLAVVYQKYVNPKPRQDDPTTPEDEKEPASLQECEVYIKGIKRASITTEQEVSGDKLMATAVAAISEEVKREKNTNPNHPDLVRLRETETWTVIPFGGQQHPAVDCYFLRGGGQACLPAGTTPPDYPPPPGASTPFLMYSLPATADDSFDISNTIQTEVIGKYPYLVTTARPTTECRVGFHSLRFTPEQALYSENFTPPTKITSLA